MGKKQTCFKRWKEHHFNRHRSIFQLAKLLHLMAMSISTMVLVSNGSMDKNATRTWRGHLPHQSWHSMGYKLYCCTTIIICFRCKTPHWWHTLGPTVIGQAAVATSEAGTIENAKAIITVFVALGSGQWGHWGAGTCAGPKNPDTTESCKVTTDDKIWLSTSLPNMLRLIHTSNSHHIESCHPYPPSHGL